jgi:hypothetical protein
MCTVPKVQFGPWQVTTVRVQGEEFPILWVKGTREGTEPFEGLIESNKCERDMGVWCLKVHWSKKSVFE